MELSNVIMNNKEMMETAVENILLMAHRRGYFDSDNKNKIDGIVKDLQESKTAFLNKKIGIYYENTKITNISSGSEIDSFLSSNTDTVKFVVVKDFQRKVYKQVQTYKNSEIFFIYQFLEDVTKKDFIPEHQLLSKDDVEKLKQKYELENLPKIYNTDPMCRYYNGQVGDVFRIIRYNINSGTSVYYRVVIPDTTIYFLNNK